MREGGGMEGGREFGSEGCRGELGRHGEREGGRELGREGAWIVNMSLGGLK